jgi:uncharacterized protein YjlB
VKEGVEHEAVSLAANDWIPNHPRLPVLLYRRVLRGDEPDPAAAFEACFERNGWPAQWRDGIYDFHHFHPATHEVLGIARGRARVLLGGPTPVGREFAVSAGDVILLPAGTGHCRIEASSDFLVVGGYPPGQDTAISRKALGEDALEAMLHVGFPMSDPVAGREGPVTQYWTRH